MEETQLVSDLEVQVDKSEGTQKSVSGEKKPYSSPFCLDTLVMGNIISDKMISKDLGFVSFWIIVFKEQ